MKISECPDLAQCQALLDAFFEKYPNGQLCGETAGCLLRLRAAGILMRGKLGGWMGGLVYAIGSRGCGVPDVLNSELEQAFGTTMSTVYTRAAEIRRVLEI